MSKLPYLIAGGAGYVLGARAGRERYEQIRSTFLRVKSNPTVQSTARSAAESAKDAAPVVKDKLAGAADSVAGKVKPGGTSNGVTLEESGLPKA